MESVPPASAGYEVSTIRVNGWIKETSLTHLLTQAVLTADADGTDSISDAKLFVFDQIDSPLWPRSFNLWPTLQH